MKAIILAVVIILLPCVMWAAKISVDANTQKTTPSTNELLDERLAKCITYTAIGKRLHTVLEEISAQTGVIINCGSSKDDWKVRDLPIVVCVKDLPLEKLLRGIADCCHLQFTSSKIEGVRRYRILRGPVREKAITDYLLKRDGYQDTRTNYEWDTLVMLGSMSDCDIKVDPAEFKKKTGSDFTQIMDLARIMASLPADAKQRILAGERITIKAQNLPAKLATSLRNFYRDAWDKDQKSQAGMTSFEPKPVSESDLQNVKLTFSATEGEYKSISKVLETSTGIFANTLAIGIPLDDLSRIIPNCPKPPQLPQMPKYDCAKSMICLEDARKTGVELKKSIKIKKPDVKREIIFSDCVAAVSDTSGYSIICEDFDSYQSQGTEDFDIFDRKYSLDYVLSNLSSHTDWMIDKDSKMLVGMAKYWCDRHDRLVAESLIEYLLYKLNTEGVELDDAVAIKEQLTSGQYSDWIQDNRELRMLAWYLMADKEPFWKLYSSLSDYDKNRANSMSGLPLADFDPWYLASIFKESADGERKIVMRSDNPLREILSAVKNKLEMQECLREWLLQTYPEIAESGVQGAGIDLDQLVTEMKEAFPGIAKDAFTIPTDPAVIITLTLRVQQINPKPLVSTNETKNEVGNTHWDNAENGISKHRYRMSIEGPGISLEIAGPNLSFPIYSQKREEEILQKLQNKNETQ
ncbi:MAG: hypothetical protein ABFD64_07155 [Armatimonadota bacterium]